MDLNQLALQPELLFNESFEKSDFNSGLWQQRLEEILHICEEESFQNGSELLSILENKGSLRFSNNCSHHIFLIKQSKPTMSEALGGLLLSLIWLRSKKTFFKILYMKGRYFFLSADGEVCRINSNQNQNLSASEKFDLFQSDDCCDLSSSDLVKKYFEALCDSYIKEEKLDSLKRAQSYMIAFDPKDVKWLARRGLLLKRLGNFSEALSDLKRYLSFQNFEEAPEAIKSALVELEGLRALENFSNYSVH